MNTFGKKFESKKGVISTGDTELDKKMGGGIPVGSLTLIEGQSDAGKSVFSQQLLWGCLNNKYKASLFTTENTVKSLITQMQSLNMDIVDHLLLDHFRIYPIQMMKAKETPEQMFQLLLRAIESERGQDVIFLDSLTSFITHAPIEETISFFEHCKDYCNEGMSIFNVIHSYAFSEGTLIRIRSMCDAHFRLRIEEIGSQLVKSLEVAKIRGADKTTGNIIAFDVEPRWGMRILPQSKAKA